MTPAQTWGKAFYRVITTRGFTRRQVAAGTFHEPATVDKWVRGESLPMHESAVMVAEFLDAPELGRLSARLHTRSCARCETEFIYGGRRESAKYCSQRCTKAAHADAERAADRDRRYQQAKANTERLKVYRAAVDAFCRQCEPEGLCRTPECPIQVAHLSPLPYARRNAA